MIGIIRHWHRRATPCTTTTLIIAWIGELVDFVAISTASS